VRRQLRNTRVAGIAVHHGQEIGVGKWPAIIPRAQWDFAQELLQFRSAAAHTKRGAKQPRAYILRGLVVCGKCGTTMAGCSGILYRCSRANRRDDMKCDRTMRAEPLEKFVEDEAIRLLENLSVNPRRRRSPATDAAEREIDEDTQQLKDLHDMWISKEITTAEYRKDRREIQARINRNEKKLTVRVKSPQAIADLIGPDAKARWDTLTSERKNSILRFLFRAVIIGPRSASVPFGSVDYSRIDIEPNDLG
jgi:site-specific DNA recombinase